MLNNNNDRGIAMILTLFLMSALSILAASFMFLSQTETYASMNYRMMSQARYAAEAGVQQAANFLFDPAQYTKPNNTGIDLLANYDYTSSPVKYNGRPVILSAMSGVASNYPLAAVVTAFNNKAHGTLTSGNATLGYNAYAKLISMQTFDPYGGPAAGSAGVVQTWEITAEGTQGGSRPATVQVTAYAEQPVWPANSYGAFATGNTCGALSFQGDTTIDSYDSSGLSGTTSPTLSASGGNVGTNGNLDLGGHATIEGNLYTPRTGVGACTAGAVNALSETGHADVTGSMVRLPASVAYPTPTAPSPMPPTTAVSITSANAALGCTLLGFLPGQCTITVSGGNTTISINNGGAPILLPSVSLSSHVTLEIAASSAPAQVANINSLDLTGGGSIAVKATAPNQSVIVNVAGKNPDGTDMSTPIDFGGNSSGGQFANNSTCAGCSVYDASMLQFVYGGTGTIDLRGNSSAAATVYAPNAAISFYGTADLFGSILGKTVIDNGDADIHYDRRLSRDFYVEGAQMIGTFSWKRN